MARTKPEFIIVMVSVPGLKEGTRISKAVLSARLAACVAIIPGARSMYWWKGKITRSQEAMLVAKTTKCRYQKLEKKIMELHSYEVPEIIAVPVVDGLPQYFDWINREVSN